MVKNNGVPLGGNLYGSILDRTIKNMGMESFLISGGKN